ncbi:hypothetical protein ACEYYB_03570 [Paracoccus sp. p4-l81]|uniref:hypothetical protein n=1 Tax=Paracoccus sp. p4-l81 TaxID=3342806 RepID=UPI0035BA70B6
MKNVIAATLCCALLGACATNSQGQTDYSQPRTPTLAEGAGIGIVALLGIGLLGATLLSKAGSDAVNSQ